MLSKSNVREWLPAIVFCVVAAIAVASCQDRGRSTSMSADPTGTTRSAADEAGEQRRKEQNWIYEMQERVRHNLKDSRSAEFRNVHFSDRSGAPVVCGEVNSKNSFGGMSGFQRFVAAGDVQALEEQMGPGEMDKTWAQVCG